MHKCLHKYLNRTVNGQSPFRHPLGNSFIAWKLPYYILSSTVVSIFTYHCSSLSRSDHLPKHFTFPLPCIAREEQILTYCIVDIAFQCCLTILMMIQILLPSKPSSYYCTFILVSIGWTVGGSNLLVQTDIPVANGTSQH